MFLLCMYVCIAIYYNYVQYNVIGVQICMQLNIVYYFVYISHCTVRVFMTIYMQFYPEMEVLINDNNKTRHTL